MSASISASRLSPIEKFYADARARPDLDGLLTLEALNDIEVVGGPSMFKIGPAVLEWYELLRRHAMATESTFDPVELLGRAINDVGRGEPEALRGFAIRQDMLALEQAGNHYVKALDMAFVAPRFAKLVRGVSREGGAELARAISNSKDVVRDISIMESALIGENSDEAWNTPGGYKRVTCGDDEDYHLAFVDSNGCEHYAPRRRNAVDRWYALADAYYEKGEAFPTIPLEVIDDFLPGIDTTQRSAVYEQVVCLREGPASLMHGVTVLGLASAMAEAGAHRIRLRVNGRVPRIMHAQTAQGLHGAAEALAEAVQKAVSSAKERRGRRRLINPWDPYTSVNPRNYTDEVVGNARRRDYRASAAASAAAASAAAAAPQGLGKAECARVGEVVEDEEEEEGEEGVEGGEDGEFSVFSTEAVVVGDKPTDVHLCLHLRGGGTLVADALQLWQQMQKDPKLDPRELARSIVSARLRVSVPLPAASFGVIDTYQACVSLMKATYESACGTEDDPAPYPASFPPSAAAAAASASEDSDCAPPGGLCAGVAGVEPPFGACLVASVSESVKKKKISVGEFLFGSTATTDVAIPPPIIGVPALLVGKPAPTAAFLEYLNVRHGWLWSVGDADPLANPRVPGWDDVAAPGWVSPYITAGWAAVATFLAVAAVALPWYVVGVFICGGASWVSLQSYRALGFYQGLKQLASQSCAIPEFWGFPVARTATGEALVVQALRRPPDMMMANSRIRVKGGVLELDAEEEHYDYYTDDSVQARIAAAYQVPVRITFLQSARFVAFRPSDASFQDFIGWLAGVARLTPNVLLNTVVHAGAQALGLSCVSFSNKRSFGQNLFRTCAAAAAGALSSDVLDSNTKTLYDGIRLVMGVQNTKFTLLSLVTLPTGATDVDYASDYMAGVAAAAAICYNQCKGNSELIRHPAVASHVTYASDGKAQCQRGADGNAAVVGFLIAMLYIRVTAKPSYDGVLRAEIGATNAAAEEEGEVEGEVPASDGWWQTAVGWWDALFRNLDVPEPCDGDEITAESSARRLAARRRAMNRRDGAGIYEALTPKGLWNQLAGIDPTAGNMKRVDREFLTLVRAEPERTTTLDSVYGGRTVRQFLADERFSGLRAVQEMKKRWAEIDDDSIFADTEQAAELRVRLNKPPATLAPPQARYNASAAAAAPSAPTRAEPKKKTPSPNGGVRGMDQSAQSAYDAARHVSTALRLPELRGMPHAEILPVLVEKARSSLSAFSDEFSGTSLDSAAAFIAQHALSNKVPFMNLLGFFYTQPVLRNMLRDSTQRARLDATLRNNAELVRAGASEVVHDVSRRREADENAMADFEAIFNDNSTLVRGGTSVRPLPPGLRSMSAGEYIASSAGQRKSGLSTYGTRKDIHRAGGGYAPGGTGRAMSGENVHGPDDDVMYVYSDAEDEEDMRAEALISSRPNSLESYCGLLLQTQSIEYGSITGRGSIVRYSLPSDDDLSFILTALDVVNPNIKGDARSIISGLPSEVVMTFTCASDKVKNPATIKVNLRHSGYHYQTWTGRVGGEDRTVGAILIPIGRRKSSGRLGVFLTDEPTLFARVTAEAKVMAEASKVVRDGVSGLVTHAYNTLEGDCGTALLQQGAVTAIHVASIKLDGVPKVVKNLAFPLSSMWTEVEPEAQFVAQSLPGVLSMTAEAHFPHSEDFQVLEKAQESYFRTPIARIRPASVSALNPIFCPGSPRPWEREGRTYRVLGAVANATHAFLPPSTASILAEEERAGRTLPVDGAALQVSIAALQKEAGEVWRGHTPLPMGTPQLRRVAFAAALCYSARNTSDGGACARYGFAVPLGCAPTKRFFFRSLLRNDRLDEFLDEVEAVYQYLHHSSVGIPLHVFGKAEPMSISKLTSGRHRTIKMMEMSLHVIAVAGSSYQRQPIPTGYLAELARVHQQAPMACGIDCPYIGNLDDLFALRAAKQGATARRYLIGSELSRSLAAWGAVNVRSTTTCAGADVSAWDKSIPSALQEACYVSCLRGLDPRVAVNLHNYANRDGVMVINGMYFEQSTPKVYSWCSGSPLTLCGNTLIHHAILSPLKLPFVVQGDDSVVIFGDGVVPSEAAQKLKKHYSAFGLTVKEVSVGEGAFEFCKMSYVDGRTVLHVNDIIAKASLRSSSLSVLESLIVCSDAVCEGTASLLTDLGADPVLVETAKRHELPLPPLTVF